MATRRNAKRSKKVVISKLEQLDELIRSNHWKMMVYEMATNLYKRKEY